MTSLPPRRPKQPNRRRHDRLDVDAAARLLAGEAVLTGRIENIAPGGAAFITADMEPEVPAGTQVTLTAPGAGDDGGELSIRGRVLRVDSMCDVSGDSRVYALVFDHPIDVPASEGPPDTE